MGANENLETCPVDMRDPGFHPIYPKEGANQQYALADTVVVAKGDAVMLDGNGALVLGTPANLTITTFVGVAVEPAGFAGAGLNAAVKVMVHKPTPGEQFWVPNESGTPAAANDVGELVDLESEDGIDVTDEALGTDGVGFHIDAVDVTNDCVKGTFRGYKS